MSILVATCRWGALAGAALTAANAAGAPTVVTLSLAEAEQRSAQVALDPARAGALAAAAEDSLAAARTSGMPRVTLDGSYRYQTEVPKARLGPTEVQFGQHNGYSVGPTVSYKIYDGGVDEKSAASLERLVRARHNEQDAARLKAVLEVRQAYARVQGSLEELKLVGDSLRLAQSRLKDIRRRVRAGSAGRLELLSGRSEEGQLRLRYVQSQTALADAVRRLAVLTGWDGLPAELIPVGSWEGATADGVPPANVTVVVDTMESSARRLEALVRGAPKVTHPSLMALVERASASRLAAEAKETESQPTVSAFVRSTYDYPNGPLDESIWQNSFGLAVSMVLYDGGLKRSLASGQRAEAQAAEYQKDQLMRDLQAAWLDAGANRQGIAAQRAIANLQIETATQAARLTASNFAAGAGTYLEVERANSQVLEAKTMLLRLLAQEINALAALDYLSSNTPSPRPETTP